MTSVCQKSRVLVFFALVLLVGAVPCQAHFGMVIPSDNMVMQGDAKSIQVTLSFSHPFEMVGMELVSPDAFIVSFDGNTTDLRKDLKPVKVMDHGAWQLDYAVKRPGAYIFAMTPQPYWEPAEDVFIIHYTKTVVAAFGDDEGWDAELGLKTEIVPLAKPYAQYAGNIFQGIVKFNGKPVPYAEVEVGILQRQKNLRGAQRLHGDPDHQGRWKRRVLLCRPVRRVVGVRGPERGGLHHGFKGREKRRGAGGRDLGPF